MRKPHQHEQSGKRFDCSNPDCKQPFKLRDAYITNITWQKQRRSKPRTASREVQHARYIDCGPLNWDDQ